MAKGASTARRARPKKATAAKKKTARARATAARGGTAKREEKPRKGPGAFGIRTAPKGDRFHEPEMALRKYSLAMPESSEDFPWGHRAFRIAKKVFLFLAWDDGVFTVTAKLPQSQTMALTLPFATPTGYGMGKSGWVTARFAGRDEVPVGLLVQWIDESFRAVAPKKVAARLSAG